ncbi:hypothetical protein ACFOLK_11420 [Marinococcus halophilus]|uniref:Uncharacterized protein n=1 Tax=Marinococcus halophilus TaxID=1371 RepID=A0A510Y1J7_MARHA|nr:hypothetical protein [Marinococcus halophilus]GEK57154.1 hypothetical protein MHA01_00590 [Marinococcus halophilus]
MKEYVQFELIADEDDDHEIEDDDDGMVDFMLITPEDEEPTEVENNDKSNDRNSRS